MNESTRQHYESIGVEGVLDEIARGVFGPGKSVARNEAEAWVLAKQTKDASIREARTLAIAEEALSTAKSANLIASEQLVAARRNARYAMYAAAVAMTAAIVSAKEEIWALIAKLL